MGTNRNFLTDEALDSAKEVLNKMLDTIDDVKEQNSVLLGCKKNNVNYNVFRSVMYDALKTTPYPMEPRKPRFEMTPIEKMYSAILCVRDPDELWPYMPTDAVETLRHVMQSNLREKEINILTERVSEGKTLEEVAKEYGLTRERIRQIEAQSLRKLRAPYLVKLLTFGLAEMKAMDAEIAKAREEVVNKRKEELLEEAKKRVETDCQKLLDNSIDSLNLSVRSWHCLRRAGIHTIEELAKLTENDLQHIRNMGIRSVEEVISKCSAIGIHIQRIA